MMLQASEAMGETLDEFLAQHGETVTLWRVGKGLATSLADGAQSPVPFAPVTVEVLFEDRMGGRPGGEARVYIEGEVVNDNSLTSPGVEWKVQRQGEPAQLPVVGGFKPLGSGPEVAWWTGIVATGGKTGKDDDG